MVLKVFRNLIKFKHYRTMLPMILSKSLEGYSYLIVYSNEFSSKIVCITIEKHNSTLECKWLNVYLL